MTTQLAPEGKPLSNRAKVLIAIAGVLGLLSILITGVFTYLLAPPNKVLVVSMVAGTGESAREQLKADCGKLPGVKVVADQGSRNPDIQGRFPVRFQIGLASPAQEAALEACINRHTTVLGYLAEGDQ